MISAEEMRKKCDDNYQKSLLEHVNKQISRLNDDIEEFLKEEDFVYDDKNFVYSKKYGTEEEMNLIFNGFATSDYGKKLLDLGYKITLSKSQPIYEYSLNISWW